MVVGRDGVKEIGGDEQKAVRIRGREEERAVVRGERERSREG